MTERRSRADFLERLLAQEERVSEVDYAAYRRRLAARLAGARRPRRTDARALLAGMAALLLLGLWLGRGRDTPDRRIRRGELVVLRLPPAAAPGPLEQKADLVATATLGPPFRLRDETLFPLRFDRVLKGTGGGPDRPAVGPEPLDVCCVWSEPRPPLRQDDRVLVYLEKSKPAGWALLELRPVDERFQQRFQAVVDAASCQDPAAEYRKLLAPGKGGVDLPAAIPLMCCPDSRSSDAVLDQLRTLTGRLKRGGAGAQERPNGELVGELTRAVAVLARLGEARAAVPVAGCTPYLPRGRRDQVFSHLPELCRAAAEPVREPVRDALLAEVRDRDAALVDATGAARALAALAPTAPDAERHRIRQAALDVLAGYVPEPQPTPEPSPESRAFVRTLVVLLGKAGITPEERQQIREVVKNRKAGWFREELAPLTP